MKPIAWIGSNFDEAYLTWDKPHPDDDPNPVAVYHESDVAPLVEALRAAPSIMGISPQEFYLAYSEWYANNLAILSTLDADGRGG